ncbi:hypothetical protein [Rubrivirga sp. IMCC45206]|uniref:hypothetical protein n=1 Tax=Rubrivirga sp. IMCC45206 TaxID=3391614 RepID=UPI00398F9F3E
MILRRITQHVRDQNWTAVAIDFAIVVVGVFVGLQASNWNADRVDQRREATFRAGLARDVQSDVAEIDAVLHVATVRMSALAWLIESATGEPLPDGFDSARGRIAIEPVPPYDPADARTVGISAFILTTLDGTRLTYDTIVSTEGIGVIGDAGLVREIQQYYAQVDKARTFEAELRLNWDRLVAEQQRAGLSPVDALPAAALAARFRGDPALVAAAKTYWLFTNRHLKLMGDLRHEAQALLARLDPDAP